MNRTGLGIALAVAGVVGVLFAVYPGLDLDISGLFFDPSSGLFKVNAQPWVNHSRDAARLVVALIVTPAFLTLFGKLVMRGWRMPIGGRAAMFLVLTLALGPGVLANMILKDHYGRSRPIDVTQFGGTDRFTPWWDPRGDCPTNCSFIAGEPSGAFWTLAPAALAPPQWRLFAYGVALAFGAAVGLLRIAAGGHFLTDVTFSGVFIFLLIWTMHGLLFRWKSTHIPDDAVERARLQAAEGARGVLTGLLRRFSGSAGKPS